MPYNNTFNDITNLAKKRTPFLLIISFDKKNIFVKPLDKLKNIYYKFKNKQNFTNINKKYQEYYLNKFPLDFRIYQKSIQKVKEKILKGDTYLLNLTFKTKIETNIELKDIFKLSKADFKLYFNNEFICFSPERFIKIEDNIISTYPMKGTIDADILNAKDKILNNPKEMAEHIMMVDLMRNDLSIVSKNVKVDKFRYIQKINAGDKQLLQVSSKISGKLNNNWQDDLGDILDKLLPAGSISGTPKKKTIEIINDIENYDREFYSGIFGIFDGKNLDSSVMIRFIEKDENNLYYKSGGGITIDSDEQSEYQELLDKIYLPL